MFPPSAAVTSAGAAIIVVSPTQQKVVSGSPDPGTYIKKGKAIPLQPLTGPEGSRRLSLPDFKTIGT
jgi:hypothetical protein